MNFKNIKVENYDNELFRLLYKNEDEFYPNVSKEEFGLKEEEDLTEYSDKEVVRKNFEATFYGKSREVFAAFNQESDIVGFIAIDTQFTSKKLPEKITPCIYVLLTLVDSDYRGRGIGKKLNQAILNYLQGDRWIARRTQVSNNISREYIESLGFDEVNRTKEQGYEQIYYAENSSDLDI